MKILYVNDNDLIGRRFNGHDLQIMLNKKKGYEAKQAVIAKQGTDPNTIRLINTEGGYFIRNKCREMEEKLSIQSMIYPFGELLREHPAFKEADIVHYHLLFNHFMSLYSFKHLAQEKPTVWTLHDPWALTGHCVHPIDCKGWLTGCHNCPHLDRYSPLKEDNSHDIWEIKKGIYKDIDIDIVVASPWMLDLVKRSPLTKHFKRTHLIPFGIDTNIFKKNIKHKELRKKMSIDEKSFVIMFRQDEQEWKGLPYIKQLLEKLDQSLNLTILTVGNTGLLDKYKDKFPIIEYEWLNEPEQLVELYSVANLFLMPSIAESFGMMAIEAMGCSLPVVVFEGTALPSVTFAPECGIALEKENPDEFVETVTRLVKSSDECKRRGDTGRKLVEENYNIELYNQRMMKLYDEISARIK
jgi:glycosyltransferase involved in cell wall biosynthesis